MKRVGTASSALPPSMPMNSMGRIQLRCTDSPYMLFSFSLTRSHGDSISSSWAAAVLCDIKQPPSPENRRNLFLAFYRELLGDGFDTRRQPAHLAAGSEFICNSLGNSPHPRRF